MTNNFKELREAAGITQEAAAKQLGVSQSAVSQWESGLCLPRGEMLPWIAALYGCTIDQFFKGGL